MTIGIRVSLLCSTLPTAALAQSVQWQTNQMQGMMANAAAGIVVNDASDASRVLIRSAGPADGEPTEWSTTRFGDASSNHPDYSTATLLNGINLLIENSQWPLLPPPPALTVGFGGISTGGDFCPRINSSGQLEIVGTNSWYFLSVTVAKKLPAHLYGQDNTALRSLADHQYQALLSYYLEGSSGITPSLVNSTVIEQTGIQLGFQASSNVDVAGLDWGMGAKSVDPDEAIAQVLAPVRGRLYFTLTQGWIATHPGFRVEDPALPATTPVDASSIYLMTWDESLLIWTKPKIAVHSADLFGENPVHPQEIDALSVYYRNSTTTPPFLRVVLSTTLASYSANQLLGYDRQTMTQALPLKTAADVLVAERIGLISVGDIDEVDGTCGTDPESAGYVDRQLGTPMLNYIPNDPKPLGLAVYRSISGNPDGAEVVDRVDLTVTGINLATGATGLVEYQVGGLQQWYHLGTVDVSSDSTTANFAYPGGLGHLGPVCITATLRDAVTMKVLRSSWISVLDY